MFIKIIILPLLLAFNWVDKYNVLVFINRGFVFELYNNSYINVFVNRCH